MRGRVSWDDIARLQHRLDEVLSEVVEVRAVLSAMQIEWEDVRDQVVRSYKRLEQAERRAEGRANPPAPVQTEMPVDEATDSFSRKRRQMREQVNAVQSGPTTPTG